MLPEIAIKQKESPNYHSAYPRENTETPYILIAGHVTLNLRQALSAILYFDSFMPTICGVYECCPAVLCLASHVDQVLAILVSKQVESFGVRMTVQLFDIFLRHLYFYLDSNKK